MDDLSGNELDFEWDAAKAAANLGKHGVSLETAVAVFAQEVIWNIDGR
jgi:uncharacterized DUF497 family protein